MSEQEQSQDNFRCVPLNNYIQTMASDCGTAGTNYVQFGVNPQQVLAPNWGEQIPCQPEHYMTNDILHSNPTNSRSINSLVSSLYMESISNHEVNSSNQMYYQQQNMHQSMSVNDNNGLLKSLSIGETNYIGAAYENTTPNRIDHCHVPSYSTQGLMNREYGLFTSQSMPLARDLSNQNVNGEQLINTFVGRWTPNHMGTYSPFGGSSTLTTIPTSVSEVQNLDSKARTNVEVKDTKLNKLTTTTALATATTTSVKTAKSRPTYSDILTKSAPTPPSPQIIPPVQWKVKNVTKKVSVKNAKNKARPYVLKRQNSSSSDDHNLPVIPISKSELEKENCNLPRRWVSLDNLESQTDFHDLNTFDKAEQFEKKKVSRPLRKLEKSETLNNTKVTTDSNCKIPGYPPKRSIQINNNLNTITSLNEATPSSPPPPEQVEKNHQVVNKMCKPERKSIKEKNFKRSHNEKLSQLKKSQRFHKNENKESSIHDLGKHVYKHLNRWSKVGLKIFYWLLHLICDVVSMSANLMIQLGKCAWYHTILYLKYSRVYIAGAFSRFSIVNAFGKRVDGWFGSSKYAFWRKKHSKRDKKEEEATNWMHNGLESNIALPSTGEEAMKRLLACKGKDPYSILGVTPTCSDDDIKKYYKRQAFLVHPDKNNQPGADEAFKILVHAFDIIGEPERRQAFDQTIQVEAAWNELNDLLSQLHRKMEQAANTIRCTNCGLRHKRIPTQRPCYAARFCAQCKIRHSAKEGDIWAESRLMGFLWYYYACMDGVVYDVTDWAACQAGNLKHLKANTHSVQYRIVLGLRTPSQTANSGSTAKKRQPVDSQKSEADIEDFLNNLYDQNKSGNHCRSTGEPNSCKHDSRRRKAKRKK